MAAGNFHENGKLEKLARIHQRFCKNSNKVTKREILTIGDYQKMANFGRKREIWAKMASMRKTHQEFGQIFKGDDKKGHLNKWRFYENYKFGKNL